MKLATNIEISPEQLGSVCKTWKIRELSLFGSVLRSDFDADSDIDVLISFQDDASIGLWELAAIAEDLQALFGRKVDLVEKEALRNPIRKKEILSTCEVLYAA